MTRTSPETRLKSFKILKGIQSGLFESYIEDTIAEGIDMAKAFAYARFSSDEQNANSIDVQMHAIQEAAARNGDRIVETYQDEALSARDSDREDFMRMYKDVRDTAEQNGIKRVYVYKYSRFMRNRYLSMTYKRRLERFGVKVVSATEPLPDNGPLADFTESIIEGIDQFQSALTGALSLDGLKQVVRNGYWSGGPAPFGYRLIRVPNAEGHMRKGELISRTKLEIDADEARIIRRAFEIAAATGHGGSRIYKQLCAEFGGPVLGRKGKPLGAGGVNSILRNPIYKGCVVYNSHGFRLKAGFGGGDADEEGAV